MKGKKVDTEFISEFICKSVQKGFDTNDLILNKAKQMINDIDEQIKKVEQLKIKRSKLLDVIGTFGKIQKENKIKDENNLIYYKILYPNICLKICNELSKSNIDFNEFKKTKFAEHDLCFSIKQLLELKVISKIANVIFRGEKFEEYLKFSLKKNK